MFRHHLPKVEVDDFNVDMGSVADEDDKELFG